MNEETILWDKTSDDLVKKLDKILKDAQKEEKKYRTLIEKVIKVKEHVKGLDE